ncbi:MAG TPA: hypothetical protein VNA17_04185 [Pyrinomonadaceae bacterium]|nr:hypothetical protein [Pyrinomonadaceae bacterium]
MRKQAFFAKSCKEVWANVAQKPTVSLYSVAKVIDDHIETTIAPASVSAGKLNATINQQQIETHLLKLGAARPALTVTIAEPGWPGVNK